MIRAVTPLLPLLLGIVLLVVGVTVLRSFGPRFRVGRLLSTTPHVSIADAGALAAGPARYVGVRGRVDADDEFEDDAHRPLVFRRVRLERHDGRRWVTFEDHRQAVDFELHEGLDAIGIDGGALDAGLVVVGRESVGTAADVADQLPEGIPPATAIRMRVEQVSSVEHAIALGVPRLDPEGRPRLEAGLGRPLVLTTLEVPDAIRVLAEGRTRRPLAAAICLAAGLVLVTIGLIWGALEALA
jgi:hypothetical protein